MKPWDPEAAMEFSAAIGEGGYGLYTDRDIGPCALCGHPCVLAEHKCPSGTVYGRGRLVLTPDEEKAVMATLSWTGAPAEQFILNYRDGIFMALLARSLIVDEGHFIVSVGFDFVPPSEELRDEVDEDDLWALNAARWIADDLRLQSRRIEHDDKVHLLRAVADELQIELDEPFEHNDPWRFGPDGDPF